MKDRSTPWNFHNTDKVMISPNHQYRLVYYDLNEIAMGAPLGGKCFLEISEKEKIEIDDWCGGPAVWEDRGDRLAIPLWRKTPEDGFAQQIAVLDLSERKLNIFSKKFSVLQLQSFKDGCIQGLISPTHQPSPLFFELKEEVTESIKLLSLE